MVTALTIDVMPVLSQIRLRRLGATSRFLAKNNPFYFHQCGHYIDRIKLLDIDFNSA